MQFRFLFPPISGRAATPPPPPRASTSFCFVLFLSRIKRSAKFFSFKCPSERGNERAREFHGDIYRRATLPDNRDDMPCFYLRFCGCIGCSWNFVVIRNAPPSGTMADFVVVFCISRHTLFALSIHSREHSVCVCVCVRVPPRPRNFSHSPTDIAPAIQLLEMWGIVSEFLFFPRNFQAKAPGRPNGRKRGIF